MSMIVAFTSKELTQLKKLVRAPLKRENEKLKKEIEMLNRRLSYYQNEIRFPNSEF